METTAFGSAAARLFAAALMLAMVSPPGVRAAELGVSGRHPVELRDRPRCTGCHAADTEVVSKPIAVFNHEADWLPRHRFYTAGNGHLCAACHKTSFCTSCHAYKEELKPSDKESASVERWLPHRGDYLFQHRIDGRIDPAACYRCHGRQNNGTCKRCHR